ncbi:MAG: UbiA family prenyltransferase [Planctomycetota bacterium]|nr:UbiA family prenyltransferase [Planctomycetota bacterium]
MRAAAVPGLTRPFTLLAPLVGVASGALVAYGAGASPWRWGPVLLATGSAALATAASNAWNQAYDVELDRINKPSRPIPRGDASVGEALWLGHACAVLALVLGAMASTWFVACVGLGLVGTWFYSAPPLRTKRKPFRALITIAVPRGLGVPVAGWSVLAVPDVSDPWALGFVTFLFVLGAAATKDFADMDGDERYGCRTLPLILGARRAARVVAPFLVVPFLLYVPLQQLGLLHAPLLHLAVLSGVLVIAGAATARLLLNDPQQLAERGENHPAWIGMYLLMLGAHVGVAIAYVL